MPDTLVYYPISDLLICATTIEGDSSSLQLVDFKENSPERLFFTKATIRLE